MLTDEARRDERPKCGACGKSLLDGAVAELDDTSRTNMTVRSSLPVLVDFRARWWVHPRAGIASRCRSRMRCAS